MANTLQTNSYRQPWLYGPWHDILFILSPAFLATALVLLFPSVFQTAASMGAGTWLLLVVCVDVAHVYSSLYRTYFDRDEFSRYKRPLILIPLVGWGTGIALYALDPMWFWRALAYLAVFHFVRQQYGFLRLYSRREKAGGITRHIDGFAIYMATLYPLVHWHLHPAKPFEWFVKGDFLILHSAWLEPLAFGLWVLSLLLYAVKEGRMMLVHRTFNLPRNAIVLGTALSWYVGIVLAEGDLAFTVTNVVSHGVPYLALIWFYGRKRDLSQPGRSRWIFRPIALPVFIGLLMLLGYLEEGLWDGWIWKEHGSLFPWSEGWSQLDQPWVLAVLVPLLAVPQFTHYLIDGFIWKIRRPGSEVSDALK